MRGGPPITHHFGVGLHPLHEAAISLVRPEAEQETQGQHQHLPRFRAHTVVHCFLGDPARLPHFYDEVDRQRDEVAYDDMSKGVLDHSATVLPQSPYRRQMLIYDHAPHCSSTGCTSPAPAVCTRSSLCWRPPLPVGQLGAAPDGLAAAAAGMLRTLHGCWLPGGCCCSLMLLHVASCLGG
jgi:hypothetical protein